MVDDDGLMLMLERELDRPESRLAAREREHLRVLLDRDWDVPLSVAERRRLELIAASAVRDRDDALREERIAGELRQNYLTWLGLGSAALVAQRVRARRARVHLGLWADIVLSLLAGALGSLSGVLRLRSPESRLTALKNLGLVMLVQPLLGAVGGLITFAIWSSGLVTIAGLREGDSASVAVVAFAGGFSERFFLKSLIRITGSSRANGAPRGRRVIPHYRLCGVSSAGLEAIRCAEQVAAAPLAGRSPPNATRAPAEASLISAETYRIVEEEHLARAERLMRAHATHRKPRCASRQETSRAGQPKRDFS